MGYRLLLAVPFLIGDRRAAGPDGRDRHLPRHRRRHLPAADDPAVSRAPRLLELPVGPDAAVPRADGRLGQARGLRALEAAAAQRGHLLRRGAGAAAAAAPDRPRWPRCRPSRSRWRSCCRPTSSARRSRCSPTTWRSCSRCSRSNAYTRTRVTARPPPSPWPAFASRGPCSRGSRSCGWRWWRRSSCCAAAGRCASWPPAGGARRWRWLPLAALVVEWNGLVPPSADPASCGLCTDRPGVGRDALTLRTVGFTVALLGVYAAIVLGPATCAPHPPAPQPRGAPRPLGARLAGGQGAGGRARGERPQRLPLERVIALAAAVGVLLLLISPLEYHPVQPGSPGDAGWLWRVADSLPTLLGSSLVFWALVPLGAVAAALLARRAGWAALPSVYLAAFLRRRSARSGSSTRSTSTRSRCWRWRCSPGRATSGPAATTRASRCSCAGLGGLRAQLRRLAIGFRRMSITNTSVSFGPIAGGEPCAP